MVDGVVVVVVGGKLSLVGVAVDRATDEFLVILALGGEPWEEMEHWIEWEVKRHSSLVVVEEVYTVGRVGCSFVVVVAMIVDEDDYETGWERRSIAQGWMMSLLRLVGRPETNH